MPGFLACRLGLIAMLALAGPVAAHAADSPAVSAGAQAPRVTVAKVKRGEIVEKVVVTGNIVARDEIYVGPEIDGLQIVELLVEEGDQVTAGQVLARLRRDTLDAQLAQNDAALAKSEAAMQQAKSQILQSESALKQAQQALERTTALRKTGFASQAVFDLQTNDERVAHARLQAARDGLALTTADRAVTTAQRQELLIRIARTEVKAPFAGLVARRTAKVGGLAAMSALEPMFRIIARGEVELEAEVPASRISLVQEGVPATVTGEGRTQRGQVRLVSPEVDRLSRLGRIRISLGADSGFKVGAFARGIVETRRVIGLSIPLSALLYGEKGPFVQVVDGGKIVAAPVTTGIIADQSVEVLTGLSEGQAYVVRAGAFLRAGDAVTPVEAEQH